MRGLLQGRIPTVASVAAVAAVLAGGGYALASSGGPTVTACVTRHSRIIYKAPCRRHDARISWNRVGPRGLRGAIGVPGPTGPAGPTGAAGPPGPSGVTTVGGWAGLINNLQPNGSLQFLGPYTTLTTTAGQSIVASSQNALGTSALTAGLALGICVATSPTATPHYLDSNGGGAFSGFTVSVPSDYPADGAGTPGPGTWTVGPCGADGSITQAIDANDYSVGYAFVSNGTVVSNARRGAAHRLR